MCEKKDGPNLMSRENNVKILLVRLVSFSIKLYDTN